MKPKRNNYAYIDGANLHRVWGLLIGNLIMENFAYGFARNMAYLKHIYF